MSDQYVAVRDRATERIAGGVWSGGVWWGAKCRACKRWVSKFDHSAESALRTAAAEPHVCSARKTGRKR